MLLRGRSICLSDACRQHNCYVIPKEHVLHLLSPQPEDIQYLSSTQSPANISYQCKIEMLTLFQNSNDHLAVI